MGNPSANDDFDDNEVLAELDFGLLVFRLAEARGPPLLGGTEPRLGGYANGLTDELDGGNNVEGGRSDCDLVCACTGNEKLGLMSHSNLVTDNSRICET